jgi:SAM-dependent methyltransferase
VTGSLSAAGDKVDAQAKASVDSLAPQKYWDSLWQNERMPRPVNPHDQSLLNHGELKFDGLFRRTLSIDRGGYRAKLIELGCARSRWLPYFAKQFGMRITGLDYSRTGCDQARVLLQQEGVVGEVVCADIFAPPANLLNEFDYVISLGLVEHFTDTAACIESCARFLKGDGKMITMIPNMKGLIGWLQRTLGREVYDLHVPLDAEQLGRAHEKAGLIPSSCEYFCFLNFGVLDLTRTRRSLPGLLLARLLNAFSVLAWMLERIGLPLGSNRVTSPYIVCIATKATAKNELA